MRRIIFTVALAILSLPLAAWSQPVGFVSTAELAEEFDLDRLAMSDSKNSAAMMVVLRGKGHYVTFVSRVDYVTVDREALPIEGRVVAAAGDLFVPGEFRFDLGKALGVEIGRPAYKEEDETDRRKGLVVLDPGHGGKDPGAVGRVLKLLEKDVVLDVAKRTARMLRERGFDVRMTRTTDVFLELDERVRFANRAQPDLFVSIHADSASPSASGSTVFIGDDELRGGKADITYRALWNHRREEPPLDKIGAEGQLSDSVKRAVFGVLMQEYRASSWKAGDRILDALSQAGGTQSRGTREENFRVVRYPACPAVLVELDFLSNRAAEQRMSQSAYRERLARGLADGVADYLEEAGAQTLEAK